MSVLEEGTHTKRGHGIGYRPEVDGLRAVAVLAVMLNHAGVPGFAGGFIGVDIFFVISGFLITAIARKELARGSFSLLDFYERRARRILPALFVMLAATCLAGWFIQSPKQLKELGQALVSIATFTANFYFPLKIGYFAEDAHYNPLIHTWSLSVEEQFYLFFPLVLWLLTMRARRWTYPVLGLLALASLGWAVHASTASPVSAFFSTAGRAWELLVGATLALAGWATRDAQRGWGAMLAAELTGALLVAGSIGLVHADTPWPGPASVPVVAGTALIILAARKHSPVGLLLSFAPIVVVGQISYSAYLWHQPIFAMARIANGHALSSAAIAACIAMTLAVAWLSWRLVETPFRGRHERKRLLVFGAALAASLATVVTGFALYRAQGLPQRYGGAVQALAATMTPSPLRDACHTDEVKTRWPEQACRYFTRHATWAVFSDSHGVEPAYALAEMLKPRGEGVLHLTFSGCPAALTYQHPAPNCTEWTRRSLAYLEAHPEIRGVLIIYRWSFDLYGDQVLTYPDMPDDPPRFLRELPPEQARARFWQSFYTLVERLRRAGKQVVIVRPVPDLPFSVERYVYGRTVDERHTGMTRAETERRHGAVNRRLDVLAHVPGVSLIDPRRLLCDARDCWSVRDGKALYFDDNHLSLVGAEQLLAMAHREGELNLTGQKAGR